MTDYGPEAKQDYAVQVEGPVVQDILQFELENLPASEETRRWWLRRRHQPAINRSPEKRRRCLSGGIIKNIAMILNAIISRCWLTPAGK